MGFSGYFLIVADFIQWSKAQGIPVGPGRGSGAGSVAAWALTITDLDPLRFNLLFERFLNPERVSMPDFDIDFCQEGRDSVIDYVRNEYGGDRVAQIITFGKLQARAAVRDVGRVLGLPFGQVNKVAELIPNNPAKPVTLQQAVDGEPRLQVLRDEDEGIGRMLEVALRVEGLYRHASTHAAGVVIGDRPLVELVPLYRDPKSDFLVTQYSMKHVEQAGLVKFDFLGLTTLTILRRAEGFLNGLGIEVDLDRLPLDDTKTFEMLQRGDAGGVFQMEGQGMRDTLRQMRPDRFEDLIAAVALYRPGPMANIPDYCRRKHGEKWDAPHPVIHDILAETYGIMVYQEQVMQIAQTMAGYSLGSADLLRRAMGKKIAAEMEAQRNIFTDGAIKRGIDPAKATEVFDLMAKFADYGFNKSHAAAYALVAYQTAWLKANHPEVFIAACMSLALNNTDRLAALKQEAERSGDQDPAAGHQSFRSRFLRRTPRRRPPGHPLCPRRRQEGRLRGHGIGRRRPRRHAVRRCHRFRHPRRSAADQPHADREPRARPAPSIDWRKTAPACSPAPKRSCAAPRPIRRKRKAARSACSAARPASRSRYAFPTCPTGLHSSAWPSRPKLSASI